MEYEYSIIKRDPKNRIYPEFLWRCRIYREDKRCIAVENCKTTYPNLKCDKNLR